MNEKLVKIVAKTFDLKESDIKPKSSMSTIEKWDSLGHLELISALEEEFKISIEPDEILQITSVSDIEEILKKKSKS